MLEQLFGAELEDVVELLFGHGSGLGSEAGPNHQVSQHHLLLRHLQTGGGQTKRLARTFVDMLVISCRPFFFHRPAWSSPPPRLWWRSDKSSLSCSDRYGELCWTPTKSKEETDESPGIIIYSHTHLYLFTHNFSHCTNVSLSLSYYTFKSLLLCLKVDLSCYIWII